MGKKKHQQDTAHLKSLFKGYLRTNWSKDPFSYGSYSFMAAGAGDHDRKTLVQPIANRVFFAGQALNPNYQSTVHAAYESGLIAVQKIVEAGRQNICIIGAGISGIGAAKALTEKGKKVTVLEGRDRIGGRVYSNRSLGTSMDLGASWIHTPDGNPISKIADKGDLKRVPTDESFQIRGKNGKTYWAITAPTWLMEVFEQFPVGTEFDKTNKEEFYQQFSKYGFGYKGTDVIFPNGYNQIFDYLKGDYEVKLNTAVNKVMHSEQGVKVATAGGELNSYDAVLVTVPLGVLKKQIIKFEPDLPVEKQTAISRMGMGVLDKLYLLFEKPFWDEDSFIVIENDLPHGHFNIWLNLHKYLGVPILMAFNSGKYAIELSQKTDEDLLKGALQTLASAYPQ